MNIEDKFKKYFQNPKNSDIEDRKSRVWQKVYASIQDSKEDFKPALEYQKEIGLFPLAASLVLVVLGGAVVQASDSSLPGDKFYNLKLVLEEMQVKITPSDEAKERLQFAMLEKRAQELIKLEDAANTTNISNEKHQEKIAAQIQITEKRLNTLALNIIKPEAETPTSENKNEVVENKPTEPEANTPTDELKEQGLVEAASNKKVTEAVTEFLRSTILEGEAKQKKLREVIEEAKEQPKNTATTTDANAGETKVPVEDENDNNSPDFQAQEITQDDSEESIDQ